MTLSLVAPLVVLALVDSTSFGTLLIPVWLLLKPGRVRVARMLLYLGTITVFYFIVGLVITLGAGAFWKPITQLLETRTALWVLLVAGVGLVVFSFRIDSKKARLRKREGGGRVARWRERAMGEGAAGSGSAAALMGLALGAATLEVATMLPYLAAIAMITAAAMGPIATAATLAAYCLVMVLPALALLIARLVADRRVEPSLRRFGDWMSKHAAGTTAWVVGIVGFLIARDAASRLGLLETLANVRIQ